MNYREPPNPKPQALADVHGPRLHARMGRLMEEQGSPLGLYSRCQGPYGGPRGEGIVSDEPGTTVTYR